MSPSTAGSRRVDAARVLADDGIVELVGAISSSRLARLRQEIEMLLTDRSPDPITQVVSASGPVHTEITGFPAIADLLADDAVRSVAAAHLGASPQLANWRAYRQLPHPPLRYRAWDWHNDQREGEVKVMVLLSDVLPDGQPMQYACGTHRHKTPLVWQSDTRFSLAQALSHSSGRILRADGPAGSTFVFDPLGIHRGTRSVVQGRDALTFTFVRADRDPPVFPLPLSTRTSRARTAARPQLGARLLSLDPKEVRREQARYALTPTIEQFKPRLAANESVAQLLRRAPSVDMTADLDLPLHPGSVDIPRDVALVALRDRDIASAACQRLAALVEATIIEPAPSYTEVFEELERAVRQLWGDRRREQPMPDLLIDLCHAAPRATTVQQQRTNLSFALAALDEQLHADPGDAGTRCAPAACARAVAACYRATVESDDRPSARC